MNIGIAIYMFVWATALILVSYFVGYRSMHKTERCTEKTIGIVVRYSTVEYNNMRLPVAKYVVNGQEYEVAGPKFKGRVTITTPFNNPYGEQNSNITSRENLPDVAVLKSNSFTGGTVNPMYELYPVGTQVEILYNPNKPKDAYVQRYVGQYPFFAFYLPVILGTMSFIGGVLILVLQPI